jgi:hypothetical protein
MTVLAMLLDKWQLKLLSLLLAAVLWLFATLEQEDERSLSMPVQVAGLPAGLALKEAVLPEINIRVTGPKILLMKHGGRVPAITLNLAGVHEGKVSFTALERNLALEAGLRVVRVQPPSLELTVVKERHRPELSDKSVKE